MKLLLFNLAMDRDDPVLGFTARWVEALAARVDAIDVVTMKAGRLDLPANVRIHSLRKEAGYGIPRRIARFYVLLSRLLARERYDACFSHMNPVFSVMGAPLLKSAGVRLVTWYAHPSLTWMLRLAHAFSDRMVTSLAPAYPYRHDKLSVVGQGIDTDLFSPGRLADCPAEPAIVLCAGRLSPVKGHETLLEAAGLLRREGAPPFRLVLAGGPAVPADHAYRERLAERARALGVAGMLELPGPQSTSALVDWYRSCTVHVNLTPAGFGDKVALEAMACGTPCLVANEGFRETLGDDADRLLFEWRDAADLANKLRSLLEASAADRRGLGLRLRARVQELHGLDRLAARLVAILSGQG